MKWKDFGLLILGILVGAGLLLAYQTRCQSAPQGSVAMNPDGYWTAVVTPTREGVTLEKNGQKLEMAPGDILEFQVSGVVNIGRGEVGPGGEPNYRDETMDSPYKDHVGGLEMLLGDGNSFRALLGGTSGRVQVGSRGVPTLRVVESLHGYCDGNNDGAFTVILRKVSQ